MKLFLRLLKESFIFSFNALVANPIRTVLSLLGVTIGIFTIIAVLSTVDSLERSIKDNLSFLGTDNLRVEKWPWDFNNPGYEWWKFFRRPEPTYNSMSFLKKILVMQKLLKFLPLEKELMSNIQIIVPELII